jgi:hypothetical protein
VRPALDARRSGHQAIQAPMPVAARASAAWNRSGLELPARFDQAKVA